MVLIPSLAEKRHKKRRKILKRKGRNSGGKIIIRHRGGGNKFIGHSPIFCYQNYFNLSGIVHNFISDFAHNKLLASIIFENGKKVLILKPRFLSLGDKIYIGATCVNSPGNSTYLKLINIGEKIHNVEIFPFSGFKLVRAAGCFAEIVKQLKKYTVLRLPSKELKVLNNLCLGVYGVLEVPLRSLIFKKAGTKRNLGYRPSVRGLAMNAVDHPHGGGEGKSPIGRKAPLSPWGKKTLGHKTVVKRKINFV